MTPADEHIMYMTDKTAWARHVAPQWAAMLKAADSERKTELWRIASTELRDELKRLARKNP